MTTIKISEDFLSSIVKEFNQSYPRYKDELYVFSNSDKELIFSFHGINHVTTLSQLHHDYELENITDDELLWLNISDLLHHLISLHERSLNKTDIQEKLKEIETSLMIHEKSFGLLSIMGYHDNVTDSDIDEYLLCTAIIPKDEIGVAVGADLWILKDKEVIISAKDLVDVFDLFRKCKKELICDLYEEVNTFNMSKYIKRLQYLQP